MLNAQKVGELRSEFAALRRQVGDQTAAFFDGPAGTQCHDA